MQNKVKLLGCLSLAVLLAGCLGSKKEETAGQKQETTVRLINVLDEKFFNDAHIAGSLNISLENLEKETATWSKDTPIVVYCANYQCSASDSGVRKLMALGFTNVKAYEAGTAGWMQAGLPVDGDAKEAYLTQPNERIHHDDEAKEEGDKEVVVKEISTDELAAALGVVVAKEEAKEEDDSVAIEEVPAASLTPVIGTEAAQDAPSLEK